MSTDSNNFGCNDSERKGPRVKGAATASGEQHQGAVFCFARPIERDPQRDHRGDGCPGGIEHQGVEFGGNSGGAEADHAQPARSVREATRPGPGLVNW